MKTESLSFEQLQISPEILKAVKLMGFETVSPIQEKAIPIMMAGKDLIGQAQTGTGKTAAFGIPLLEKIDPKSKKLQSIVLCPTRELAVQIAEEIRTLARYLSSIQILPVYGGQDIVKQLRALKAGVQLVVGTPGRVMDHMRRGTIRTDSLHTVVLDEADEMLNMGFREDIETILKEIPENRQTVLFSATMPQPILDITRHYQKDAEVIRISKKELTVPGIEQFYYEVSYKNREEVLSRLLDIYSPKLSLVFCNTKKEVDLLVNALLGRGYFAAGLHGDMKQEQRDRVMQGFREGKTEILVATDIAARGIDVEEVEAVFNYSLPQDDEYYVHRIGRTGRAGRVGHAFSFIWGREIYKLREIQSYCKTRIRAQDVPSLNDVASTRIDHLLEKAEQVIASGGLTDLIHAVEERVNASDYTAADMAAAFLKMSGGGKEDSSEIPELDPSFPSKSGMVRLFINIGKKQKIRPRDIVGALAGESGIPGKSIGTIDMYDKYTFVDIPKEYAADVLHAMRHARIKGRPIAVEPASKK
ncbi:MAG: DEAD/DEAH box helicase [Lachnospiraceae bacterium]|nr:DEAD/DEAH box helicase [Lachnospiraceae bacterium]